MTARYFIDSNVLVYAGSQHPDDQAKRMIALDLLRKPGLGFSTQVMQEYFSVAYTKARLGISLEVALENLEWLARRNTLPVTPGLVLRATRAAARHKISYWDAAILSAAKELGCHTLYSEDLNHGQEYDGVRVVNPFLRTGA
ncbi:MAG: PIN domain-containing protein [Verrucomicrobia bacterium]|nr:PIN domain-containing protein [Verrucomicrobiota bacterium]